MKQLKEDPSGEKSTLLTEANVTEKLESVRSADRSGLKSNRDDCRQCGGR
jgi:hypothetical protein